MEEAASLESSCRAFCNLQNGEEKAVSSASNILHQFGTCEQPNRSPLLASIQATQEELLQDGGHRHGHEQERREQRARRRQSRGRLHDSRSRRKTPIRLSYENHHDPTVFRLPATDLDIGGSSNECVPDERTARSRRYERRASAALLGQVRRDLQLLSSLGVSDNSNYQLNDDFEYTRTVGVRYQWQPIQRDVGDELTEPDGTE